MSFGTSDQAAAEEIRRAQMALQESEEKYRALFESIDDGVALIEIIFDQTGEAVDYRFLEINPNFERLTSLSDVVGKRILDVMPKLDRSFIRTFGEVARSGVPVRFERRGANHPNLWFTVYAARIGGEGSCQVAVLFEDITQRKEIEEAQRKNQERQEFLLKLSDAMRAVVDPLEVQQTAARLLGEHLKASRVLYFEIDEFTGKGTIHREYRCDGVTSMAGSYSLAPYGREMAQLREGRTIWSGDVQTLPREEKTKRYKLDTRAYICSPLVKMGLVVGTLTVNQTTPRQWTAEEIALVEEVSVRIWEAVERAKAEEALRRAADERAELLKREQVARAEAERAAQMKEEFLAVVSHELRTPLSAAMIWAKMLQSGTLKGEAKSDSINKIVQSLENQQQLIEDLLDVSRMVAGKLRINIEESALAPVLEAAVEAIRPMAQAKGVALQTEFDQGCCRTRMDPDRIQQVIWNLLNNAVKFTPSGGRVRMKLRRARRGVEIEVNDTGQGISAEFLPQVFERFRQADASSTRRVGGLGLGLAISRQLVEMHAGRIRAESAGLGKGATFIVWLPLRASAESDAQVKDLHPGGSEGSTISRSLAEMRILLVEDDCAMRQAVELLLQQHGAEVVSHQMASEALKTLEDRSSTGGKFDVLLSDLGLPHEDGFSLIQKIRRMKGQAGQLPAVALSAYAREEDRAKALAAGFDAHVPKPVDPDAIVDLIATLRRPR